MALEERFWSKVDKKSSDECWPWIASRNADGYGNFLLDGRPEKAHRVVFLLVHGRWPQPCCLHSCPEGDNPACCNPAHLREGTNSDNVSDREARGRGGQDKRRGDRNGRYTKPERSARGERHGRARLNQGRVGYIRQKYAAGNTTLLWLAKLLGVGKSTVYGVVSDSIWKGNTF